MQDIQKVTSETMPFQGLLSIRNTGTSLIVYVKQTMFLWEFQNSSNFWQPPLKLIICILAIKKDYRILYNEEEIVQSCIKETCRGCACCGDVFQKQNAVTVVDIFSYNSNSIGITCTSIHYISVY